MSDELQGKVALVTGGASGIGAATTEQLRARGAVVVVADIGGDNPVDVTDERAVDALVARVLDEHGRLDIAANVAGTSGTYANVADASTESWRHTMQVNLDAVFFCLRAELRAMRALGTGGAIVNVASSAGKMGVPGLAAYSARSSSSQAVQSAAPHSHRKINASWAAVGASAASNAIPTFTDRINPAFSVVGTSPALHPQCRQPDSDARYSRPPEPSTGVEGTVLRG